MWGAEDEPKTTRFKRFTERLQKLVRGNGNSKSKYDADDEEEFDNIPEPTIAGDRSAKKNSQKKKKKPYMFPHWVNYIAWICKCRHVLMNILPFLLILQTFVTFEIYYYINELNDDKVIVKILQIQKLNKIH